LAVVRVRQHVNPLGRKYQQPIDPPAWETLYANPSQPLHLDIGCGRGLFLLDMAKLQPDWNFLGLEIREPLVHQANQWQIELGLTNLHYLFCNVNNSLQPLLASLKPKTLQRVTIQFPDPWFKQRHKKRRVLQPEVVECLAMYLVPGGVVLLQSDVREMAMEMCDRFQAHPSFIRQTESWLEANPLPIATEREQLTLEKGEPVYRALFTCQKLLGTAL
jgi:tRNA (guanine-N7-)-methyltransferase